MKVIVRIQEGKFFDGRRAIRPSFGDVIELPEHIAEREIKAKTALPFKEKPKRTKPEPAVKEDGIKKTKKPKRAKKKTKKTKKPTKRTPVK